MALNNKQCLIILFCVIFLNEINLAKSNGDNYDNDDAMFKRAQNRTYIGLEKANNSEWQRDFYFIQGADTQFGMIESYLMNITDGNWTEEIELTSNAIKAWNAMQPKPKFVVICGDIVDDYPDSLYRRTAQITDLKTVFRQLDSDIPLVILGGNHDFLNEPTREAVDAYKSDFGDDYFAFWVDGCMFIVINVQYYKDHTYVKDLYDEQEKWLDEILTDAVNQSYKHIVVFQHIPWFLYNITENDDYFNIEISMRQRMIDKFYDAGVRAIFAGHYHRNAGGMYKDLQMVITSAIGAQASNNTYSGYRVVHVVENRLDHSYVEIFRISKSTRNFCSSFILLFTVFVSKFCLTCC